MLQHAQQCHTIQAFEKVVELQEQMIEMKSQNQQLIAMIKDKSDLIEKLADRLMSVEKFITSGVEIPDFVEADCPNRHPRLEPDFVEPDRVQKYSKSRVDIVEADCLRTTPRHPRAPKQTPQSQFHFTAHFIV